MSIVNGPKIATMVSAANGDTYGDGDRHELRTQQVLIQPNVISLALSTPPGSPVNGNTYIVGAAPTGLWAGQANSVAYWAVDPQDGPSITPTIATGAWEFYTPLAGWEVYDNNSGLIWRYGTPNAASAWLWSKVSGVATVSAALSVAVPFMFSYAGTTAPVVSLTPVAADPTAVGAYWVTNTGSAGAWTGFTINVHVSGTQAFNYTVAG